jgi:hypothetical protein
LCRPADVSISNGNLQAVALMGFAGDVTVFHDSRSDPALSLLIANSLDNRRHLAAFHR